MHPNKARHDHLIQFTDLPNIGPSLAGDLRLLGYQMPQDLVGADPYAMYTELCTLTSERQDPCVLDCFLSITDFLAGNPPQPWWNYTAQRKKSHPTL